MFSIDKAKLNPATKWLTQFLFFSCSEDRRILPDLLRMPRRFLRNHDGHLLPDSWRQPSPQVHSWSRRLHPQEPRYVERERPIVCAYFEGWSMWGDEGVFSCHFAHRLLFSHELKKKKWKVFRVSGFSWLTLLNFCFPAMGFRPLPRAENVESTLVWYKNGDSADIQHWVESLNEFIKRKLSL